MFYGGIVNAVVKAPNIYELPAHLEIRRYAVLHIKCFKENNTPVVGNIVDRIGSKALEKIRTDVTHMSVGSCISVWGYKTIFKYANEIG